MDPGPTPWLRVAHNVHIFKYATCCAAVLHRTPLAQISPVDQKPQHGFNTKHYSILASALRMACTMLADCIFHMIHNQSCDSQLLYKRLRISKLQTDTTPNTTALLHVNLKDTYTMQLAHYSLFQCFISPVLLLLAYYFFPSVLCDCVW